MTLDIAIVGCGPGARECLTLEAVAAIEQAEVLIGSAHILKLFAHLKSERIALRGYREEVVAAVERCAGRRIVVVVTGDPGLASLSNAVLDRFGRTACRVLPGISSVQVAFARLGLSWEGARILSAHAALPAFSFESLAMEQTIAVLTGNADSMQWVASLAEALGGSWRTTVAQDLTLSSERIFEATPNELAALPQPLRAVIVFCRKDQA